MNLKEDIKRVIAYIHAHGFILRYTTKKKSVDFEGLIDYTNRVVYICVPSKKVTKKVLMTLLHEAGHVMDWVNLGRPIDYEMPEFLKSDDKEMSKSQRQALLRFEKRGIYNMRKLVKQLGLSVTRDEIEKQINDDLQPYIRFAKTGKF